MVLKKHELDICIRLVLTCKLCLPTGYGLRVANVMKDAMLSSGVERLDVPEDLSEVEATPSPPGTTPILDIVTTATGKDGDFSKDNLEQTDMQLG